MGKYPGAGIIKWTGHATSDSEITLSCYYSGKVRYVGAVPNGTIGLGAVGKITIVPLNFKLKTGATKIEQPVGFSQFGQEMMFDITPTSDYKNSELVFNASIWGATSDTVLTANIYTD